MSDFMYLKFKIALEQIEETKKSKKSSRNWITVLREYTILIVFLILSALFTGFLTVPIYTPSLALLDIAETGLTSF